MNFPSKLLENAVNQLSSLPGIGKKSALRLVLQMIKKDKNTIHQFSNAFIDLIENISYCSECYSISETEICNICIDKNRNQSIICVVEDIRVMMAIESTLEFQGRYHVLGGLISPMDGIGPEDLKIEELIQKIDKENINEVILALSTTMEGDTTNFYLYNKLNNKSINISSIARGISIGNELEYTDEVTLGTAISSRLPYENSLVK